MEGAELELDPKENSYTWVFHSSTNGLISHYQAVQDLYTVYYVTPSCLHVAIPDWQLRRAFTDNIFLVSFHYNYIYYRIEQITPSHEEYYSNSRKTPAAQLHVSPRTPNLTPITTPLFFIPKCHITCRNHSRRQRAALLSPNFEMVDKWPYSNRCSYLQVSGRGPDDLGDHCRSLLMEKSVKVIECVH